MTEMLPNIS